MLKLNIKLLIDPPKKLTMAHLSPSVHRDGRPCAPLTIPYLQNKLSASKCSYCQQFFFTSDCGYAFKSTENSFKLEKAIVGRNLRQAPATPLRCWSPAIRYKQLLARTCCNLHNKFSPNILREHLARAPVAPLRRWSRRRSHATEILTNKRTNQPTDTMDRNTSWRM